MKRILCLLLGHKDGEKEISYIDELRNHYMSTCKRCGEEIFYDIEEGDK